MSDTIARQAIPLLLAAGLDAAHVDGDLIRVRDGRGVVVQLHVRRLDHVAEAVWRVLDRVAP